MQQPIQPVFDAFEKEIQIGDKVLYCINDNWAAGVVTGFKPSAWGTHVQVQKIAFPAWNNNYKVGRAIIQFSHKLLIVPNFDILDNKDLQIALTTL